LILAALPAACTWVRETPGGDKVRVAYDGNVSGCRDAGAITVFGHPTRSRSTIARPEGARRTRDAGAHAGAAGIPADTIKPTGEPADGSQTFEAYVCGSVVVRQHEARPAPAADGEAETHAIKDH
jgi:hypothetical protein